MLLLKSMRKMLSFFLHAIFLFLCLVNFNSSAQTVKPYIISNPQGQNLVIGDTLVISVKASGTTPFSYQWYDTADIAFPGATDSIFRLGPLSLSDNLKGFYCIVGNIAGLVSTQTAIVNVKRPGSELILVNGELYTNEGALIGYSSKIKKDMIVKLYPSISGGSAVYSESFLEADGNGVDVLQSKFSISLGSGVTSDNLRNIVRENANLFVEFQVCPPGGIPEILSPRLPLTSAPYSLSGTPEQLSGNVDPVSAGITAPIGTHYVNKSSGKTFIKTHNSWVSLD